MKRIRTAATNIGLGIGAAYAFFLVPQIEGLFKPEFVLLVRQGMAVGFGICIFVNPKGLVQAGVDFAPMVLSLLQKITAILQIFIGSKDKNDEKDNS